jgi:hypothetical protein
MLLQAPVRTVVLLFVPVVLSGKGVVSYNRNLLLVNSVLVLPLAIGLLSFDALYSLRVVWSKATTEELVAVIACTSVAGDQFLPPSGDMIPCAYSHRTLTLAPLLCSCSA